ncbi:centrosome-associated protein Alms1a-like [Musca domestica]|uniref:Centrosome-associated protein Alms1a-like n=1 Tax=Musca domestica TaxID=7370 RepID=A0A9J7I0C6_MUSDO|nr:centrosome-associated protein Alms1a-like [Musca domestica]
MDHCHRLPKTPRNNEKTMKYSEYYKKYGKHRNLEKFLRIHSPASSEAISSNSSCEALASMKNLLGANCCKSMPNIRDKDEVQFSGSVKDILVDINIELEDESLKVVCNSNENLYTPKKPANGADIQVKTPDSIAKTHRRLEWDSLGDIGYKKSMSTSNISVLERSLLKEFFKESSVTSEPSKLHEDDKVLENNLQLKAQNKQLENVKNSAMEHATPPLACSTLVEGLSAKTNTRGARPKMLSKSTSSTSLQKKFEKYAQTSMLKSAAGTKSQEIQVSMSSSTSVIEGTATPSSFEYYSSRSSKSRSSISSSSAAAAATSSNFSNTSIPPTAQHPFITSITDLLKKRKALNEKSMQKSNTQQTINELKSRFQAALEENKENQSHTNTTTSTTNSFSLTRQAPELDLGIQLICSLIDAKKVNEKQKKKLIRDIVRRLTRLMDEQGEESASLGVNHQGQNSTSSDKSNVYDAVYSRRGSSSTRSNNTLATQDRRASQDLVGERELGLKLLDGNYSKQGVAQLTSKSIEAHDKPSIAINTNHRRISQDRAQKMVEGIKSLNGNDLQKTLSQGHDRPPRDGKATQFPTESIKRRTLCDRGQQTNSLDLKPSSSSSPTIVSTNTHHKQVPILEPQAMKNSNNVQNELINEQMERAKKNDSEQLILNIKTTRSTQTSNSPSSTMSKKLQKASTARTTSASGNATTSTSSRSSNDLPTQKTVRKNPTNYDTDGDQATMREWLNPLTQSEIEYEEKKREEENKKKAAQREALKREKSSKKTKQHSCGREKQLNWIESEIHRLECLKHLLLKDQDHTNTSSNLCSSDQSHVLPIKETFNLTQSDKLYDSVYSDKSSVLSESAERLVKEIQVILEESSEEGTPFNDSSKQNGEQQEIEKSINVEKSEHVINSNPIQRQKIDTPPGGTDHSEETGSLRDMVKQRKQEFMASYKTKKQNHYDILKQQQKVEARFKYFPIGKETQGYYSVPHTMNRRFSPTEYAYPQSNLPPTPKDREIGNSSSSSSHVIYSTTAATAAGLKPSFPKRQELAKPSTSDSRIAVTTTSASSPSIFCMSSDCSVPMGSKNISSTPTTTHHYDDVAAAVAGVAVQTSDSCHAHKLQPYISHCPPRPGTTFQTSIAKAAAIQVKPKGIAYVIEFDDSKESNNNVLKNTQSAGTFTTNNLTSLEKEGPPQLTLQEHLKRAKPNFLKHTKERKAILNELQTMRQERDRQLREIVDNTSFNSLERRLKYLPPPPMQKLRILKTKEMKALTNKRVASLPEVVARKQQELEEKRRRGNRILRDVFNLRLQKRVRSGKLSLNHSKVVI